jgi:hypothetical protein
MSKATKKSKLNKGKRKERNEGVNKMWCLPSETISRSLNL